MVSSNFVDPPRWTDVLRAFEVTTSHIVKEFHKSPPIHRSGVHKIAIAGLFTIEIPSITVLSSPVANFEVGLKISSSDVS